MLMFDLVICNNFQNDRDLFSLERIGSAIPNLFHCLAHYRSMPLECMTTVAFKVVLLVLDEMKIVLIGMQ